MFLTSLFEELNELDNSGKVRFAVVDQEDRRHFVTANQKSAERVADQQGREVRTIYDPKPLRAGQHPLKLIKDDKDQQDVVALDVPLLIRILEYAREDSKSDIDLHNLVELILQRRKGNSPFTMADYESIVPKSVTEAVVSAKEKKMNPGVGIGQDVYVKAPGFEWTLRVAKLLRLGASGLAHIRLKQSMGDHPDVPDYFKGQTDIAVPPSWLFSTIEDAWPADWKKPATKQPKQEKLL